MNTCPHLKDGTCTIATTLAQKPVIPHATACDFCTTKAEPRQQMNQVTVSIAVAATAGTPLQRELLKLYGFWLARSQNNQDRLQKIMQSHGPGSQLWRLLESLGVRHTADCQCLTRAEQMNAWGPAGCRLARAEIVEHMRTHAPAYGWATFVQAAGRAVLTGLAWRIDLTDPYGSLVDEAIRLAEVAAQSSVPAIPAVP